MERPQTPLVVFGPDHIDTSRAEMLVQCLSDKIKEKRFKLQKMIGINEEKKKRNEMMKSENLQLTSKLATIEQENSVREQQLQSEQARIKDLQLNIQLLDDHNNSIKRNFTNEEHKYDEEKVTLITKFERTKQKWTEVFKPQYEQSKVYQYLKQTDLVYNSLLERKEFLLRTQKLAYQDYSARREEFCNERNLQLTILSMGKYFLLRRDRLMEIHQMKEKFIELENKQKQLMESKIDKMKAWESVYTQPVKRDLMDFCLQTNIDQALTLSFTQMQQDIWSQPMTPVVPTVLTPQNEHIELVPEENNHMKPTVTFQSPISVIHEESAHQSHASTLVQPMASTITVAPSVRHLTTAIEDDDDELFSTSRRKMPIAQMEKMTIQETVPSTQAFVVSMSAINSNIGDDEEVSSISQNDQPLTQAFTVASEPTSTSIQSTSMDDSVIATLDTEVPESTVLPSTDPKSHSTAAFQLATSRIQNRPVISTTSSIQPQVTSNDVQQMLLTFSPDPSSMSEEQPQPMEDDPGQLHVQQQRPTFSMPSSIESTASTEDGYTSFNYNFGFDGTTTGDASSGGNGFTSPINFGNWSNLGSPMATGSNDQFAAFLQQTNSGENGVDNSFSFASFNYADLTGSVDETSADGAFGSFFFGNGGNTMHNEQTNDGKSN